jgi:magnesium transporter
MPRFIKGRSKKAGLPPGTPVHIGEKRPEETKITIIDYSSTDFRTREVRQVEECLPSPGVQGVTWVNVEGIHQLDLIEKFGACFHFHPLVLEDISNADQRPKVEDYHDYLYVVLKMLRHDPGLKEILVEQVSLVIGEGYVLSFQEGLHGDSFNSVRERLSSEKSRIRSLGADYLAYALIDAIVDNYFAILEKLGESIESLEEELVSNPTPVTLQVIHHLKRDLIFLRRSVWPLREVVSWMERGESPIVKSSTKIYLRDIYDHTIQVIDAVETFRDTVSGMLDIYLSSISNRLNAIMKVLTIIATIFMPLTFLAGVYGMNFKHMPELDWVWGYPMILSVMALVAATMLLYFRRKKWL